MKKKILSILLSVVVAIAMIPAAGAVAFAEDYGTVIDGVSMNSSIGDVVRLDYVNGNVSYIRDCNSDAPVITVEVCGMASKDGVEGFTPDKPDAEAFVVHDGDLVLTFNANLGNVIASETGTVLKVNGKLTIECYNNTGNGDLGIITEGNSPVIIADEIEIKDGVKVYTAGGIECKGAFVNNGELSVSNTKKYNLNTGIDCNSLTNNGNLTFKVDDWFGNGIDTAIEASESFENNGTVETKNKAKSGIITNSFNQKDGSIVMEGIKGYGIKYGSYSHTGGEVTVSINDANLASGGSYASVYSDTDAKGPKTEGLDITASNNVDGSDPVAYDPAGVLNGYKYLNIKVGTAHEHSWDNGKVTVQPTCTKAGTKTFTCTGCTETKKEAIAAKGHTPVAVAAKKATMTANGTTAGQKCSACNAVLKSGQAIPAAKTVTTKASAVYTGKAIKPAVTVKDAKGNAISTSNYTVSYANNAKVGKATAKVTFKGNYTGTKSLAFKINPKKPALKSVAAGKKKMTVKVSAKVASTGGSTYQIAYREQGTSKWKFATTTGQSKVIKSLKKGKKYQVKIRAYKTVSKVNYYGAWSAAKTTAKIK